MVSLSEKFLLMLSFSLVVSGLFLVGFCVAPVTMPSHPSATPEIVSVVVNHKPVWVPPIIYTNPFTGTTTEMSPSYWRQEGAIDITIKNRPFTPYTDQNGNNIDIYYCTFHKRPSSNTWYSNSEIGAPDTVYQSDYGHTVITYKYGTQSFIGYIDGDICFRVQAIEGYFDRDNRIYEGEGSEWFEFVVAIPKSEDKPSVSNSKPSTPKPSFSSPQSTLPQNVSEFDPIIIFVSVCIITILLLIIVYLFYSRQRKTKLAQTQP
jgi:hypothetical protein